MIPSEILEANQGWKIFLAEMPMEQEIWPKSFLGGRGLTLFRAGLVTSSLWTDLKLTIQTACFYLVIQQRAVLST